MVNFMNQSSEINAGNQCKAPFVHIGFQRSGSTSLQSIFGDSEYGFATDRVFCNRTSAQVKNKRILRYLIRTHDLDFNPEHLRSITDEMLGWARPAGRVPLISSERLAGHWYTGGHDSKVIADRIKMVWPDARILMIFREQKSMINSVYRQYIKKGGNCAFDELLHPRGTGHNRGPLFSLRFFIYDQLVEYYHKLFGPDYVLALP